MYAARTTSYQGSIMVDICDLDLIGSKLEQGDLVISLTREYYQQQVIEQPYAQDLLHKCDIANLVGERIVKQALDMKLAKEAGIKRIAGVPFLMLYKFQRR
ncbi:MAG: hypothetical protein AUJ08_04515 [Thaumarchaeota archaeon 13_1_40CM_3_50_5]|nr:MAG: hypothetical protein AUH37_00700 [Candidatus Nitrososphaera sp. 13_1_40CM_48_12]OLC83952.1 MAG: hypothetical protein AUJ08_04515 [Thaumarchaeota archaeon 13_1_40CM_3_50_5]